MISDGKTNQSIKTISVILIMAFILCFTGCSVIETRTDIEPLFNHLPDLLIKSACWYGGVKEDRFSGSGPCTYVIYGAAKTDEDFIQDIKEEYDWIGGDTGQIFDLLARLDSKDYLDKEQNYLYSEDFIKDITNTFNSDVLTNPEENIINFDVFVSFENDTIVFYAELMNF